MALKSGPNPRRTTLIGGGVMHTWRFTWQTFSPEKRHVRRQFDVFSMPDSHLLPVDVVEALQDLGRSGVRYGGGGGVEDDHGVVGGGRLRDVGECRRGAL